MHRRIAFFRGLLMTFLGLSMVFSQGCNCDNTVKRNDPMTIKILSPAGRVISSGFVRARVEDLDGIATVQVFVNGKEVAKKDAKGETTYTISTNFDLDAQPDTFEIKIVGEDITQEKKERKLTVRKDQGAPQVRFLLPTKLDPKHDKIYVGKQFKSSAEARDSDGIAEIVISMTTDGKSEQTVRSCAINKTADVWEKCEADLNLSDAKYKSGDLILLATATDAKGKTPDRKTKLQIVLDKDGPTIQIVSPNAGQRLKGGETFEARVRDQVGVKKVEMWAGPKQLQVQPGKSADSYLAMIDKSVINGSKVQLKVVAYDNLDNKSEKTLENRGGCQRDSDCTEPGTRCCITTSPANKDGSKTGRCFKVQNTEGALCDPCTNPCGKGPDGKLMGCLAGACGRPPYRCRRACNLGSPTQAADDCAKANPATGQPAEYCAPSDITKINPSLGSCAHGDNCDPLKQTTCQPGATPPYNKCCPQGFGCYPADRDANICIPEGSSQPGATNCENNNCKGGRNCTKGHLCVTPTDAQGRPVGPSKCSPMCVCDSLCQSGLPISPGGCKTGICGPVRWTNGNVPVPVGVCITR